MLVSKSLSNHKYVLESLGVSMLCFIYTPPMHATLKQAFFHQPVPTFNYPLSLNFWGSEFNCRGLGLQVSGFWFLALVFGF